MNVVFLDIDGVLQPYDSENIFYEIDSKVKMLVKKLSEKYGIDFSQYNVYDILAVYYDWHNDAVSRLMHILDETGAKIIISSDWRSNKKIYKMRDLLKIRNLDTYWLADNPIIKKASLVENRALEINESLAKYPIDNFVVLDDLEGLKYYFPNNAVITYDYLKTSDMNECIKILKKGKY